MTSWKGAAADLPRNKTASHEAHAIRAQGLRALNPALLHTRIDDAQRLGYIDQAQAAAMRLATVFAQGHSAGKAECVCSILARRPLQDRAAVQGLLCCWGGGALHGHDRDMQRIISQLGTPSLVLPATSCSPSSRQASSRTS